ncbi:hypothetical protein HXX76_006880 [Chlamydomonas incerta]|uniref:Flagellar associated protein n=1 Tax=Chlamydomonas incerta TaxID=51695 RepID=A0A835TCZ2_CHLIN|nr:hypothetical protein HXX76_006880 [Chlamydomonas incerta]|eukprot:KAG2435680.1 hypothetical protein HXX76_006880 [Chlamydomonas incerta]
MAQSVFKEIEKGNLPGLKRCISLYSACVTAKNPGGATPLHLAAALGLPSFVRELLLHGAPHDATDNSGSVPLHLAAEQGSVESVVELLTGPGRKLMVKQKNRDGQTPLHLAVRNSHIEVVAKLIDAGARTDAKDKAGNTPLELVDGQNEELLELLLAVPANNGPAGGAGAGTPLHASGAIRASTDTPLSAYRNAPGGATTPAARGVAGTPSSARPTSAVSAGARTPLAGSGTPGAGARTALPRTSINATAGQLTPGSGAAGAGGSTTGPTVAMQLQKHDHAIQELQSEMRAATERLIAVDATAHAQIESASQLERALELTGKHNRALSELEERVDFAEERGKDTRGRLERLEDGERSLQETTGRLSSDQRGLGAQLRELSEQVVLLSNSAARTVASDASTNSHATQALHAELAALRAQVDQLAPALAVATAASAEARAVSSRLDAVQHQQQAAGGSIALEQQVVQLQAQVQLLQLPVATLTQQCAELSSKLTGLTEWQHRAQAELARLAAVPARNGEGLTGAELSGTVMTVLDTTSAALAELKQQQDATARQVAALLQLQAGVQASPGSPGPGAGTPAVPSTPNGGAGRSSLGNAGTPLGGLGSNTPQPPGELRAEVEALRALLGDLKKDMATEGGSIRREWQRAFSDMQSRYGEQANELRAREQNIAKLREAALVEEAERRAQAGYEDMYLKRLTKLETSAEYLTHRMEVLEEQMSGLTATVHGGVSPSAAVSPSRTHGAAAAAAGARSTPRSGAGPVSEHSFATPVSHVTSAAAASLLSSLATTPLAGGSKAQLAARVAAELEALGAAQSSGVVSKAPATGGVLRKGPLFAVSSPGKAVGAVSRTPLQPAPQLEQQAGCHGSDGGHEPWWRPAQAQQELGAQRSSQLQQQPTSTAYGQCQLGVVTPALAMGVASATAVPAHGGAPMPAPAVFPAASGQGHGHQLAQQWSCLPMHTPYYQQRGATGPDVLPVVPPGAADPASLAAAGPQLQMLPAHAQSILTPSVDIQRLAAAAQLQQQQQLQHMQHRQLGGMLTAAGAANAEAGTLLVPAATGPGHTKARPQEPPACLNCTVQ